MSSIPNPVSQPQMPVDVPAAVRQTTDDVRQSLHQHLRKTASFIKFMDSLVLFFSWIAVMMLIWLFACGVDHWLWPLTSWGRWLFWSLGMVGSLWWLGWQLLPLVVRRINPVYAAKRIEHLVPEFKNGLISWLELEALPEHGVPRGVMSALAYRAARFIGGQDPSATVDTSPLIKIIGCVLLLSTGLVLYTMLSPKSAFATGKRIVFPWSSTAPPTRVQILEVNPGAIELTQGKPLEVEVAVKGLRRDEQVAVRASTLDGQIHNQRTSLNATTEGFRYSGKIVTDGPGVEQPLDYWIEAGDAVSGPFRVSLSPLPSVVLQSIELQYPPYTQLEPRTISGEKVEAVEGTRLTFRAQTNQPLARGRVEVNPSLDEAGALVRAQSFIDMEIDQRQMAAQMILQLDAGKTNPTKVEYRIRGYNQRGDSNSRPITHTLNVLADVPPEVTLLGPENRLLRVRANSRINLEVRASDPDFGLSRLCLKPSRNGVGAPDIVLLEADAARGRQVKTYSIDLTGTRASVGEQFELVAVAEDNRHDPISQQIAPNITRSLPLVLQVVGPNETPDVPLSSPNEAQPNAAKEPAGNQPSSDNSQQAPANPSNNGTNQPAGQQPPENGAQTPSNSVQNEAQNKQPADNPPSDKQQQEGQSGGSASSGGSSAQSGSKGEQPDGQGQSANGSGSSGSSSPANPSQSSGRSGSNQSGSNQSGNQSGSNQSGSNQSGSNQSGSNQSSDSQAGNNPSNNNPSGNNSASGGKPSSDGEAIQRVSEYLKSQPEQSGSEASASQTASNNQPNQSQPEKDQSSDTAGSAGKPESVPSGSEGSAANSSAEQNQQHQPPSQTPSNNSNPAGGQQAKQDAVNPSTPDSGTPPASDSKSKASPATDKPSSDSQAQRSDTSASQSSNSQPSNSPPPQGSDAQSSQPNQSQSSNPQSQNQKTQGSDSKGSDAKGSDSKGSEGSDAQGSEGSDAKGSDAKGSDAKGSDAKGSDAKGSDAKGADAKGSDAKGI